MKVPTERQIRSWSPDERMRVRSRAAKMGTEVGRQTMELIDLLNLPLSSGGMAADHPLYREMMEVAWSAEGKAAALKAVQEGRPAMAGVDPLLQKVMGSRYSAEQQGTLNAGYIVGEVMRHLGFEKDSEAPLPTNCIAKTAATWKANKPLWSK